MVRGFVCSCLQKSVPSAGGFVRFLTAPPASLAVSCDPSSCCQLAQKLPACLSEDSRLAALPFPVAVVSPLVLFLSVGSSCAQNALKSVLRLPSRANPINMYSLDSIGWKGRRVSLFQKNGSSPLPKVTSSSADLFFLVWNGEKKQNTWEGEPCAQFIIPLSSKVIPLDSSFYSVTISRRFCFGAEMEPPCLGVPFPTALRVTPGPSARRAGLACSSGNQPHFP